MGPLARCRVSWLVSRGEGGKKEKTLVCIVIKMHSRGDAVDANVPAAGFARGGAGEANDCVLGFAQSVSQSVSDSPVGSFLASNARGNDIQQTERKK